MNSNIYSLEQKLAYSVPNHCSQKVQNVNRQGLHPTLPSCSSRYDKTNRVEVSHTTIEATAHCSSNIPVPSYLPRDWRSHVHPEGNAYFSRQSQLTIVTEAYILRTDVMEILSSWIALIEALISESGICLQNSVELWLNLDAAKESCMYYFVDHASRAVFWLETVETETLGLPPSISPSHLKHALEENYWNHVEMFPMHIGNFPLDALEEIISVFMHARADHLTSTCSTFPYTAAECASFLDLLRSSRDRISDGRTICFISRLWVVVANHRYFTHYGEEHSRLSSNQPILNARPVERSLILTGLSSLLFGMPECYRSQLEDLFVDDLTYISQWKSFVSATSDEWKTLMQWTFALLISNILILPVAFTPARITTILSILLCTGSLIMGMILSQQQQTLAKASTGEAATYLHDHRSRYGYQPLAIVFSLPKGLFIWALVLFAIQAFCLVFFSLPPTFALVSAAVISMSALAIWWTMRPSQYTPNENKSTWSWRFWRSSDRDTVLDECKA